MDDLDREWDIGELKKKLSPFWRGLYSAWEKIAVMYCKTYSCAATRWRERVRRHRPRRRSGCAID